MNDWIRRYEAAEFVEQGAKIGDLVEKYFADRKREGKTVHGIEGAWVRLKPTFEYLTPIDLNKPEIVEGEERTICHRYAVQMEKAKKSKATIHHDLNCLRTILNWAAKPNRKLIEKTGIWVPPVPKRRNNQISVAQFEALMMACQRPHLRIFVILAIFTAQRKAAILELTWDRVKFDEGTIDFKVDDSEKSILDTSTQKGRAFVDIPASLHGVLHQAYLWRRTDHVIEYAGRPVKDVKTALNYALKAAGLKEKGDKKFIGSHSLRKSAATWLAHAGAEPRRIQKLLGHEEFETTEQWYIDQLPGYTSPVVNQIEQTLGANIFSRGDAATRAPKTEGKAPLEETKKFAVQKSISYNED
jgi:integrase